MGNLPWWFIGVLCLLAVIAVATRRLRYGPPRHRNRDES